MAMKYRAQDENGKIFDYDRRPHKNDTYWNAFGPCRFMNTGKRNPNWQTACFDLSEGEPVIIDGILCAPKMTDERAQSIIDTVVNGMGVTRISAQDMFVGKHPLESVFEAAIAQATQGKGTRHGGELTPFLEQPWAHYYDLHGRGFLTGQAAKKLEEAASIKSGQEFVNEALGAIVYIAMAIIKENEKIIDKSID